MAKTAVTGLAGMIEEFEPEFGDSLDDEMQKQQDADANKDKGATGAGDASDTKNTDKDKDEGAGDGGEQDADKDADSKDDGDGKDGAGKDGEGDGKDKNDGGKNGDEGEETPEAFWGDLEKIRGNKIPGFDNTAPLTPEGVLQLEQAVRTQVRKESEEQWRSSDPRSYSYKLHRENGGSDDDFFNRKGFVLPEVGELAASVDLQKNLYHRLLTSKGLDADTATIAVNQAVEKNTIGNKAQEAYDAFQKADKELMESMEADQKKQAELFQRESAKMVKNVDSAIDNNQLDIRVPEADKAAFKEFASENIIIGEDGKFYLSSEINPEELNKTLTSLYLLYRKGNLDEFVAAKAKTQIVNRLRRTTQQGTPAKGAGDNKDKSVQKDYIPMGDMVGGSDD